MRIQRSCLCAAHSRLRVAAFAVLCVVAMLGSACTLTFDGGDGAVVSAADDLASRIDPIVEAAMEASRIPGISVGIMQGDDVVLAKGYGFADVENQVPATENTVYRIGSVTKQFTAAAIMLLVEEGKLTLDADLTEFFPDYPTGGRRVTIERLLNHTSGIKGYTEMRELGDVERDDLTHEQLIELFSSAPFEFEPGDRYQYNNSAFYLLGVIIEKISGVSYAEFIRQQIFEPLGMDNSHYLYVASIVPRRAEGYEVRDGELVNDSYLSMHLPYAAGSLGSSVVDLLAWQRALIHSRAVNPASFASMTAPGVLNDGSAIDYGYGLGLSEMEGHRKIQHGGGINGFRTQLSYYPDDELTVVVLANIGSADPAVLESRIAHSMLGIADEPLVEVELSAAELEMYAGVYNPGRAPIGVRLVDGALRTLGDRLVALGDHRFVMESDPYARITFTVENGVAVSMRREREGSTMVAPRVEQ